jgi:hypothetical protein
MRTNPIELHLYPYVALSRNVFARTEVTVHLKPFFKIQRLKFFVHFKAMVLYSALYVT